MIFAIDLNPIDDAIDGLGGLIGGAAEAAGEAVLDLVVSFTFGLIADAVAAITNSIITAMDSCLLYTSPSPRDQRGSRMPSSA